MNLIVYASWTAPEPSRTCSRAAPRGKPPYRERPFRVTALLWQPTLIRLDGFLRATAAELIELCDLASARLAFLLATAGILLPGHWIQPSRAWRRCECTAKHVRSGTSYLAHNQAQLLDKGGQSTLQGRGHASV